MVPKSTSAEELRTQLFSAYSPTVFQKFKELNPNLDQVKAGQLIVLSDPGNRQCTREDATLMSAAEQVNQVLASLTPEDRVAQYIPRGERACSRRAAEQPQKLSSSSF
ncbi:hypothetical protein C1886_18085 [Pseudomonas sp. FW300-N1A1]|nr:hypothetical protein C1886_18085 [Pseudomonas sp. FW300-N1A1]